MNKRQRFTTYRVEDDRESEDLGCGSSERSEECDDSKYACDIPGINPQKENTLRLISQTNGEALLRPYILSPTEQSARSEQLMDYIHSLEGRIKQLEKASQQNVRILMRKTVIDRCDELSNGIVSAKASPRDPKAMQTSYCSTLTTSGTTYASSETDMESAVYVMGDEIDEAVAEPNSLVYSCTKWRCRGEMLVKQHTKFNGAFCGRPLKAAIVRVFYPILNFVNHFLAGSLCNRRHCPKLRKFVRHFTNLPHPSPTRQSYMRLRKKAPGSHQPSQPLSESLLNVGRLSLTNSELSFVAESFI
ncbi:hypothetical protein KIN20_030012 [Parelaphostrongylus tenuis]|uniref:Uncharacterized protein n=1 Tax=Parelaphostrongylus tenuis TaxID=148309 RepID=A0AAD5R358_PARTN|nr:hypothetical protein KIN20_030012 [Parelaphostrongylus tenuis]